MTLVIQGENLNNQITKTGCYCLNEDARHPFSNLFIGDHTLPLQSDTDEQVTIN